jgi:hypothetical protein
MDEHESDCERGVFCVTPREGVGEIWTRIGTAVMLRDRTIVVTLKALPVSGTLTIRAFPAGGDR